jgi:hypothetical protein
MARDSSINRVAAEREAVILALRQEVAELSAHVDELALDRDERDDTIAGLRAELAAKDEEIAGLLETVPMGECRKVRHLHEDDARRHAINLAAGNPGIGFHWYVCGKCVPMPVFNTQPFHVAHCNETTCTRYVMVRQKTVHRRCGCRWSLHDELLWACERHTLRVVA